MNPYMNEDVMWQRLNDLQREAENRRLMRAERRTAGPNLVKLLAARAWLLAGLAMRRPPLRTWAAPSREDATSKAA